MFVPYAIYKKAPRVLKLLIQIHEVLMPKKVRRNEQRQICLKYKRIVDANDNAM